MFTSHILNPISSIPILSTFSTNSKKRLKTQQ